MFGGCPVLFGVSGVWKSLPLFKSHQVWKSGAGLRPSASSLCSTRSSDRISKHLNAIKGDFNLQDDCWQLSLTVDSYKRGYDASNLHFCRLEKPRETCEWEKHHFLPRSTMTYNNNVATLKASALRHQHAQEQRWKWVQDFIFLSLTNICVFACYKHIRLMSINRKTTFRCVREEFLGVEPHVLFEYWTVALLTYSLIRYGLSRNKIRI